MQVRAGAGCSSRRANETKAFQSDSMVKAADGTSNRTVSKGPVVQHQHNHFGWLIQPSTNQQLFWRQMKRIIQSHVAPSYVWFMHTSPGSRPLAAYEEARTLQALTIGRIASHTLVERDLTSGPTHSSSMYRPLAASDAMVYIPIIAVMALSGCESAWQDYKRLWLLKLLRGLAQGT
jgi:hypothetical protein